MYRTMREIIQQFGYSDHHERNTPYVSIIFRQRDTSAQARGKAKRYVRNVHVELQARIGGMGKYTSLPTCASYLYYGTCDSRYCGKKSKYGIALTERANDLAALPPQILAPAHAVPAREHPAAMPHDLYLTRRRDNHWVRFDWHGKKVGMTKKMSVPEGLIRHWPVATDDGKYWEHGANAIEIVAAYQKKIEIIREKFESHAS